LIATGVMTVENYDEYEEKLNIVFASENVFMEKMKLANFNNKLDIYATVSEYAGKLFPVETILKDVFKMTDDELKKLKKKKKIHYTLNFM